MRVKLRRRVVWCFGEISFDIGCLIGVLFCVFVFCLFVALFFLPLFLSFFLFLFCRFLFLLASFLFVCLFEFCFFVFVFLWLLFTTTLSRHSFENGERSLFCECLLNLRVFSCWGHGVCLCVRVWWSKATPFFYNLTGFFHSNYNLSIALPLSILLTFKQNTLTFNDNIYIQHTPTNVNNKNSQQNKTQITNIIRPNMH